MRIVFRMQDTKNLGWSKSRRISRALRNAHEVYQFPYERVWRHRDLPGPFGDRKLRESLRACVRDYEYPDETLCICEELRKYWFTYNTFEDMARWFSKSLLKHLCQFGGVRLYKWQVPEHRCIVGDTQTIVRKHTKRIIKRIYV